MNAGNYQIILQCHATSAGGVTWEKALPYNDRHNIQRHGIGKSLLHVAQGVFGQADSAPFFVAAGLKRFCDYLQATTGIA
jgi:hypothetical protein